MLMHVSLTASLLTLNPLDISGGAPPVYSFALAAAVWVVVAVVAVVPTIRHGSEMRMNPFLGTWVANLEKSRRHANHQFQSATLTFEVSGDVVSITHTGVNMAGKAESGTTVLHADGVEHAVSPQAPGVVAVTRWQDPSVLATEARMSGRLVGSATYVVSDDGRTLTATVGGIDAAGKAFDQIIVFDREGSMD
jgi:hypothetical protein